MPQQIITLADIAYIRETASRMGFSRVSEKNGSILFLYRENVVPDMQILSTLLNIPAYKGMILFNAGTKPYLVFRNAAKIKSQAPAAVRTLFMDYEKFISAAKSPEIWQLTICS